MKTVHPHPKGIITDTFGTRGGTHAGIDIAKSTGTPILAFAGGVVHTALGGCVVGNAQCNGGAGNYIVIDHENGYYTRYLHFSELKVKKGNRVKAGQIIGLEGTTGASTGPHLHFEIRTNPNYGMLGALDPKPFLDGKKQFPDAKNNTTWMLIIAFLLLVGLYLWYFQKGFVLMTKDKFLKLIKK
jgi:murein DD-endopeptidase MepM/ murein hydrolase activator NlpD